MNKTLRYLIVIALISLILVVGDLLLRVGDMSEPVYVDGALVIPEEILENKFGFLGGHPGDSDFILEAGAKWIRPHLGPFLWESMQEDVGEDYDFKVTDNLVKAYQDDSIGLLITLWPYAEWDLKNRLDYSDCAVGKNDEFLPDIRVKDEMYLPLHRCNPHDWNAYEDWVIAVVERYDGDGVDDMPKLVMPIKHWEVMNEPDLSWDNSEFKDTRLDFYQEGPEEYAELLKKTYTAIKSADYDAEVVIAGAAGGNESFLEFYRQVFEVSGIENYFNIANVHCISNDEYENFNVVPYSELLDEFDIDKPIWVTEAEAIVFDDSDENVEQTQESVGGALAAGAEKIFFTRFGFENDRMMDHKDSEKKLPEEEENLLNKLTKGKDDSEVVESYRGIIE